MESKRPVFWYQGLFLQPQHFQLLEQYFQSNLNALRQVTAPFLWGLKAIDLEKAALSNRTFSVSRAEMLFPDGSFVTIPGNGLIKARPIHEDVLAHSDGAPVKVYACIKKLDPNGKNVTALDSFDDLSGVNTRFVALSNPEEAIDLYENGPLGQVKMLQYLVKIAFESEKDQLEDYVFMPISAITMQGDEIAFQKDYVPPVISIDGDRYLLNLIKETRDLLAAKGFQIAQFKVQRGLHSAEFGSKDMTLLLALRTLNRFVPALFHYVETGGVHPWEVYCLMRQIVGELSSFSSSIDVLGRQTEKDIGILPYDHWDIGKCFLRAFETISRLIEEITAGPQYIISLEFDGTYFATELAPSIFKAGNRYYLAIKTSKDPDYVIGSMETAAKLSSREYLPILIAKALPGVRLTPLSIPPSELPKRSDTYYFQIDITSDQWVAIEQGKNIALYWDTAPEDTEVELMVVEASR